MTYKDFLKKRYNKIPVISARNPFKLPASKTSICDSWSQENTANIIPKPEINNHISFLIFIIYWSISLLIKIPSLVFISNEYTPLGKEDKSKIFEKLPLYKIKFSEKTLFPNKE